MGVSLIAWLAYPATLLFQAVSGWRLDLPSLAIGLLLGAGLLLLYFRVRPYLNQFRDQSVSRVQETQAWVRAGVEKRFQAETASYVRDYHLGADQATLAEVFVEPRPLAERAELALVPPRPAAANLIHLWPEAAATVANLPVPTMSLRRLLLNGRRVILSAPAGAGKTTLLAYCAHLCASASNRGPHTFLLPTMPVLVHLAELSLTAGEATPAIQESDPGTPLAQALQARAGPLTAPGVGALLRAKLAEGQVLLLLDGWDELPSGQQPPVVAWLEQLLAQYPDNQVFVAAGTRGYAPLLALHFTQSGLLPWQVRQARLAGGKWAAVFDLPDPPAPGRYWVPGRFPLATTLHLWHWAQQRTAGPATLPALLEASLPRFLPASLAPAANTEDEKGSALVAATYRLWQRLAFHLVIEQQLSFAEATLNQEMEAVLDVTGLAGSERELVRKGAMENKLLRRWANKEIGFLSPVWRDFLAARHLAQVANGWEFVHDHLHDANWEGVIRFYVARAGASNLALRLLSEKRTDPWREGLFRLARWLPETADQAEWRRQTLIRLGQLIINPDVASVVRQRAVAVLAHTGESGVVALLRQLLQRSEPDLRRAAIAALAGLDPEVSVPLLERMLKDQNASVRAAAVHALGWQNTPLAEKPLLTALISHDDTLHTAAAGALALGDDEGWEILREAAVDPELSVRRAATEGLKMLDEFWAVELLEKMAREDDEWAVRSTAEMALEAIAERNRQAPWEPILAGDLPWLLEWAAQRARAVPGGNSALPTLRLVLETGERAEYRQAAATSLASVYLPAAEVQTTEAALREAATSDPEWSVRQVAYAALVELDRRRAPA